MKLFDIFLKKKNPEVLPERENKPKENIDVSKEIDDILDILKELGFLDAFSIEKEMDSKKIEYDKSILYRLMIDIDEDSISELKRYVSNEKFGYGQLKIDEIKQKILNKVNECNEQGRSKIEIVEEIISIAKDYIREYQQKLYTFNNTIITLKENSNNEAEVIAMIAFWIDSYKEQEFGYPIDLEKKLNDEAIELRNLPDGGYGEEKIEEFLSAGRKEIEEGKKNNLSDKDILKKIMDTLVTQYKNRYIYDLDKLRKRIKTIEASTFIDDEEKQKNIAILRITFNEMYGHVFNLKENIKKMIRKLEKLEYGGYGESKIKEFESTANKIVEEGHSVGKEDKTILANIEIVFKRLINTYNERKKVLEEEIKSVDLSNNTSKEKASKKKRLKDDFKADSGHKIDLKKKVKEMIESLGNLEGGGYGQSIIRKFKVECEKILTKASNDSSNTLSVYRSIQTIYDEYIDNYVRKIKELKDINNQISQNSSLNDQEKRFAKIDFGIKFDIFTGRNINLNNIVDQFAKALQELPHGGYGRKAIIEFENYCLDTINTSKPEEKKYSLISQKANLLKARYSSNLKIFNEWKRERLELYKGDNKEEYARELDDKITYMLSLTQKELDAYFQEDDKEQRKKYQDHNTEVAVKYLAKKEAEKTNNASLFDKRVEEYHNGKNPYSEKEISRTIEELSKLSIFDESSNMEPLLDITDYIDSTLIKQISNVLV